MVNFSINNSRLELMPSPKHYTDAQDKNIDPKATYRKAQRALDRSFPHKNACLKVLREEDPIFVYDYGDETLNMHGKGATREQALASGIMEYCERLSYFEFDYKNAYGYRLESFNSLKKSYDIAHMEPVFDVVYVQDKEYYANLIKDIPLHWVGGYSLTKECESFYPVNWINLYQSTNGLAAGNTIEEAINQAICEVVERHNIGALLVDSIDPRVELVDIDSCDHPLIHKYVGYLEKSGLKVYILNVIYDVEVPTIMAYCEDPNPQTEALKIGCGFGTHPDPQKAILRAITEYMQFREGWLTQKQLSRSFDLKKGNWQYRFDIDYKALVENSPKVSYKQLPDIADNDMREEIYTMVALLEEQNYDVIVVDKTHPEMKIPMVRVFIPNTLPGCLQMSMDQNIHYLIAHLYYQADMDDVANDYYVKHFSSITEQFNMVDDMIKSMNLSINLDMMKQFITPSIVSIDQMCKKDYRESIKSFGGISQLRKSDMFKNINI